jgi:hypothetical protein
MYRVNKKRKNLKVGENNCQKLRHWPDVSNLNRMYPLRLYIAKASKKSFTTSTEDQREKGYVNADRFRMTGSG